MINITKTIVPHAFYPAYMLNGEISKTLRLGLVPAPEYFIETI